MVPQLERLGWLHVVMPVEQQMGCVVAGPRVMGQHDRVPVGAAHAGVEADARELGTQPFGRGLAIGGVGGLGGDGGDAQKAEPALLCFGEIGLGLVEDGIRLHPRIVVLQIRSRQGVA